MRKIQNELLDIKRLVENSSISHKDREFLRDKLKVFENIIRSNKISADLAFEIFKGIDDVVLQLRKSILQEGYLLDSMLYKSPINDRDTYNLMINNFGDSYPYQRSMKYRKLEKTFLDSYIINESWENRLLLFNCGMASISSLISSFSAAIASKDKIKLIALSGYFETFEFLNLLKKEVEITILRNEQEIATNDFDILYIEPITYELCMREVNISGVIKNLYNNKHHNKPRMIIFDTTLNCHVNFPLDQIQKLLSKVPLLYICEINSLIKLHQQGLELCNAGSLLISCNKKYSENLKLNDFYEYIELSRGNLGQTLDIISQKALSNYFTHDINELEKYTRKIFDNNTKISQNLRGLPLIESINYIEEYNCENYYNKSPMIILEIKGRKLSDYFFIADIINLETHNNKIIFNNGSSFGFRHSRFEVIVTDKFNKMGFLKISTGYIDYYIPNIINILRKVFSYNNMEEIKSDYTDLYNRRREFYSKYELF